MRAQLLSFKRPFDKGYLTRQPFPRRIISPQLVVLTKSLCLKMALHLGRVGRQICAREEPISATSFADNEDLVRKNFFSIGYHASIVRPKKNDRELSSLGIIRSDDDLRLSDKFVCFRSHLGFYEVYKSLACVLCEWIQLPDKYNL